MGRHCTSATIVVVLAIATQVVAGLTPAAWATAVAFSEPARVVEVTIAKSARESFLREVKVFAETFAFHSSFSPSRSNPAEPFPMLWRADFFIYFYPIPNGDARRPASQVSENGRAHV